MKGKSIMKRLMLLWGLVAGTSCVWGGELGDGWMPKFYNGLEAVGSVGWVPKAYKNKAGAIRLIWESGSMKFGAAKEVTTELTGFVDWTVEAMVKSDGNYGYAGVAMEFFDGQNRSLGISGPQRPAVAKEWRKLLWNFSAPKTAKRFFVHVLSLNKEPVMFANIKVSSKQGVDKGEIPFEVLALPAEGNAGWNGGAAKMLSFSDAPIPVSFFLKGERKGRKDLKFVIDVPAELEIKDAYCPMAGAWEKLSPSAELFVTNGVDYVRYTFSKAAFYKEMDVGRYLIDQGASCTLVVGPKAGGEGMKKSFALYYRTQLGSKRGQEKSMELVFRPLPTGLRQSKDFFVFSWNNTDRHFSSDGVANSSLRAYEVAGIRSFRRTANGGQAFPRQRELAALCEERPVKYVFSGRFGDLWHLGACGVSRAKAEELDVRMAVSSDAGYADSAARRMCPEYFLRDAKFADYLRGRIRDVLSESGVKDGDWVTFDMEPWGSATWCHCDECHKSFATFAGLDHVPTAKETQTPELADTWANFRCSHNERSVELVARFIREYNPNLKCFDYDYIMPYGDEKGMRARRRACGKDTLANEKWLDGHLCSYYHTIGKDSFLAIRNDTRHLKKSYIPMPSNDSYCHGYLRPGEVLNPRQYRQLALAAFVNGCPGCAFYSGVCYDGEMLVALMEAQDEIAKWEGLPWGKVVGKSKPSSESDQFVFASTVKPDGGEVVALFNYDAEDSIAVELAGKSYELAPQDVLFVEVK